jgi:hypothetical protein
MNRICLFVPSRGRPEQLKACFESYYDNAYDRADLVALVDDDDPKLAEYQRLDLPRGLILYGPGMKCCPKLAWGYALLRHNYSAYGMIGDDCRCETDRWDILILKALEEMGGWGVIGPCDGHRKEEWFNHFVMSANIPAALGYFVLPGLERHFWCDAMPNHLSRELGIGRYLPDVKWTHYNPWTPNGGVKDATWEANGTPEWNAPGYEVVDAWRDKGGLKADAEKIRAAMAAAGRTQG